MKTSFLKITVLAVMLIGFFAISNAQAPIIPDNLTTTGHSFNTLSDPTVGNLNDVDMVTSEAGNAAAEPIDTVVLGGQYLYGVNSYYKTYIQSSMFSGFYNGAYFRWDLYPNSVDVRPASGEIASIYYKWGAYVADGDRTGAANALDDAPVAPNGPGAPWVENDSILIDFNSTSVSAGQYTLFTSEQLIPVKNSLMSCPSNDTLLDVLVVNPPRFEVEPDTVGGCEYCLDGANPRTVNVPVIIDGAGPYEVYYTVAFFSFDGTTTIVNNYVDTLDVTMAFHDNSDAAADKTYNLRLQWSANGSGDTYGDGYELGEVPSSGAFNDYGIYRVYIDYGLDRFSNKAMNLVAPTIVQDGGGTAWAGNPSSSWDNSNYTGADDANPFYILNFPTPNAEPIRHIKNVYHNL